MSSNTVTLLEGMAIGFGLGGTIFYPWGYREGVAVYTAGGERRSPVVEG